MWTIDGYTYGSKESLIEAMKSDIWLINYQIGMLANR
jgi:hypothetical protein